MSVDGVLDFVPFFALRNALVREYAVRVSKAHDDIPSNIVSRYSRACLEQGVHDADVPVALVAKLLESVPPDWDDVSRSRTGLLLDRIDNDGDLKRSMTRDLWRRASQWNVRMHNYVHSDQEATNVVHVMLRDHAMLYIAGIDGLATYRSLMKRVEDEDAKTSEEVNKIVRKKSNRIHPIARPSTPMPKQSAVTRQRAVKGQPLKRRNAWSTPEKT